MKYEKIVTEVSTEHRLNPKLVYAICLKESNMDTWAMRFESEWRWWLSPADWAVRVAVTAQTERIAQQCSWGLMQIMGTVARERGFSGDLPQLCDPKIGVAYGCKHVNYLFTRYSDVKQVLSAYNTGRPNTKVGLAYAADVIDKMDRLKF